MSIADFRAAVENKDHEALVATLAEDCVFASPAVFKPYEGRDATAFVLAGVVRVFEDFRYVDAVIDGGSGVLRFTARVGDRTIEGVDLLRENAAGEIAELTVMIRPLSGLQAVVEAMGKMLASMQAAPAE